MDQAGQVYCGDVRAAISAACSGAIFTVPAAFGHTKPELSEAALGRLLVPVFALAERKYRTSPRSSQDGERLTFVEQSVLFAVGDCGGGHYSVDFAQLPLPCAMTRR